MNKIYNLAQTIADDKETISRLEKQLFNAKNILAAHEAAMERLTTVPKVIASVNKETPVTVGSTASESTSVNRERITMENYWELGIQSGDKVEVVVSGDRDFKNGMIYDIVDTLTKDYLEDGHRESCILELRTDYRNCWYDYGRGFTHELYLIRTPEGSLNKQ